MFVFPDGTGHVYHSPTKGQCRLGLWSVALVFFWALGVFHPLLNQFRNFYLTYMHVV